MKRRYLTAVAVRNLRPKGQRRYEVPDAGAQGLRVIVHPTGKRVWALRYRRPDDRRTAKLILGTVDADSSETPTEPRIGDHLTLASARKLAAEACRTILQGRDPAVEHFAERAKKRAEATARRRRTFEVAARSYVLHRRMGENNRSWRYTAALLGFRVESNGDLVLDDHSAKPAGRWRTLPLADITTEQIAMLLDEYVENGSPSMALATYKQLRAMLQWHLPRGALDKNPMDRLPSPARSGARERAFDDDELAAFWLGCDELGWPWGQAFQLTLLNCNRPGEVEGMRRDELKAEGWTIPAARAKNNRAHFLPLAPLSREIILGLPKVGDEYVFTLNGDRPIRARAKAKQRLDALMAKYLGRPVAAWQVRDLRRTTYTGLERLKFPIEVAEAVANHVSGTKEGLPGVYGKHDYSEEKAAALRAWAHHVRAVVRAMARKRA